MRLGIKSRSRMGIEIDSSWKLRLIFQHLMKGGIETIPISLSVKPMQGLRGDEGFIANPQNYSYINKISIIFVENRRFYSDALCEDELCTRFRFQLNFSLTPFILHKYIHI